MLCYVAVFTEYSVELCIYLILLCIAHQSCYTVLQLWFISCQLLVF